MIRLLGVRAVFGGHKEAEGARADGVGDELGHRARQLGREDVAIQPAEALDRGVRIAVVEAVPYDFIDQRLELRLVLEAVDVQQTLRLIVIGLELVEAEGPRETLVVRVGLELVRREPEQGRAVPFRLPADVVVLVRHQMAAVTVQPRLLVLVFALLEHLLGVERAAFPRQLAPLLEHQHPRPGFGDPVSGRGAAGAGADDDHVIGFAGHPMAPVQPRWSSRAA
jgi:hypothetical protein